MLISVWSSFLQSVRFSSIPCCFKNCSNSHWRLLLRRSYWWCFKIHAYDDGGCGVRAFDDDGQVPAPQLCGFCELDDARIEHSLRVLQLLPRPLELPCDVYAHVQDLLSLHAVHTVAKTEQKGTHTHIIITIVIINTHSSLRRRRKQKTIDQFHSSKQNPPQQLQ